jgi:hypothetical protein
MAAVRRSAAAAAGPSKARGRADVDPGATRFFYQPHTITFLLIGARRRPIPPPAAATSPPPLDRRAHPPPHPAGLAALVHFSGTLDPRTAPADGARAGVIAVAAAFLAYSAAQGPAPPLVRPHPAAWRLAHGVMVLYLALIVFLLFQSVDSARTFMRVRRCLCYLFTHTFEFGAFVLVYYFICISN